MMVIFASMLHERRIVMVSSRISRLSACIQAANAVIYPMIWQHIYIPVLPPHLMDYLLAPMVKPVSSLCLDLFLKLKFTLVM